VKAYQRKALPGGFVQILLLDADITHLFAQRYRTRTPINGFAKKRKGFFRRTVFNEQICIKQNRFDRNLCVCDGGDLCFQFHKASRTEMFNLFKLSYFTFRSHYFSFRPFRGRCAKIWLMSERPKEY